jgi:hypothetical protein
MDFSGNLSDDWEISPTLHYADYPKAQSMLSEATYGTFDTPNLWTKGMLLQILPEKRSHLLTRRKRRSLITGDQGLGSFGETSPLHSSSPHSGTGVGLGNPSFKLA